MSEHLCSDELYDRMIIDARKKCNSSSRILSRPMNLLEINQSFISFSLLWQDKDSGKIVAEFSLGKYSNLGILISFHHAALRLNSLYQVNISDINHQLYEFLIDVLFPVTIFSVLLESGQNRWKFVEDQFGGVATSYISERYVDGKVCDVHPNKPRETEVRYCCNFSFEFSKILINRILLRYSFCLHFK